MDILSMLRIGASGLNAERTRLETISSNIANANATRSPDGGPYRRKVPVFQTVNFSDVYEDAMGRPEGDALSVVRVMDIDQDNSAFPLVFDPTHPDANAEGYVEMPNVNPIQEMIDMLSASRAYEANLSSLETSRDLANSALDIGR